MSKASQYYGGYFWVAAVSFVIPFFVAYKALDKVKPAVKPEVNLDVSGVDNSLWDYLLKNHVASGLVDYNGMKKNCLFHEYIRQVGSADPEKLPSDEARLALACNAYNALVINGVITHKQPTSVLDVNVDMREFFDLKEHIFAGKTISLNDLEHKIIRPFFMEPRIHVALVCAARSCPAIRPEAYTPERVLSQLQDQSVAFANNKTYVDFNNETGELQLSPILKWYGEDWDKRYPDGCLQWLEELVESQDLKAKIREAIDGKIKVSYFKYDWTLNSQGDVGTSTADAGSGSVPNE